MIEKLYTIKEAADLLSVNPETIRRWDKKGKIQCIRLSNGHRRIQESEIQEYFKQTKRPITFSGNTNDVLCPICNSNYVAITKVEDGDPVIIHFEGECGHKFCIKFQFWKGNTECEETFEGYKSYNYDEGDEQ